MLSADNDAAVLHSANKRARTEVQHIYVVPCFRMQVPSESSALHTSVVWEFAGAAQNTGSVRCAFHVRSSCR